MRIAILENYPNKKLDLSQHNHIDAHLRNSIALADYLKADLLLVEEDYYRALKKQYDVLILGSGSYYSPFALIKKLSDNNPDHIKICIANEYQQAVTIGGFRPYHLIANFENIITGTNSKNILSFNFINLNLLIAGEPNKRKHEKRYDCIYYGTFRPNREKYFAEYLHEPIHLSTSNKNFKKFKHIGCNPVWIKKLSWQPTNETLNLFRYSLYIEDQETHKNFNNLANRFYEAKKCNCVQFFDANCINTIERSEIARFSEEVKRYVVHTFDELEHKIKECNKDFEGHLARQHAWLPNVSQLRGQTLEKIKELVYEIAEQSKHSNQTTICS